MNTTYCPACGLKIIVAEQNLAKNVICPSCQAVFDAPCVPGREGRTTYCPSCRLKLHVTDANLTKRPICPKCQTHLDPPLTNAAKPRQKVTGREKGAVVLVIFVLALAFVIYSEATYHPNASASDTAWKQIGAQIYLDSQQYLNAQKAGNVGDMAGAASALQKDCHNAEPLQHRGSEPASSMEQQVGQVCAGFGFPLTPLP